MSLYDKLHSIFKSMKLYIPVCYYSGKSAKGFGSVRCLINQVPYCIELNELYGKEFFYSAQDFTIEPEFTISCAKEITMPYLTAPGFSTNKEEILKVFLSHEDKNNVYFYNSNIIFSGTVLPVHDITKDILFNLSTTLSDSQFDAVRFLLEVHDNSKLEYICIHYKK